MQVLLTRPLEDSRTLAETLEAEAPYGYLWTRDLVNWIRMKLWF